MNYLARILGAVIVVALIVLAGTLMASKLRKSTPQPSGDDEKLNAQLQRQGAIDLETPDITPLVMRLSERVGVRPELVRKHLADLRIALPSDSYQEATPYQRTDAAPQDPIIAADSPAKKIAPYDLQEAIEFGLHLARLEDDYGQLGLEYEETSSPDEFEVELIDEVVQDRLGLTSKLVTTLQEMHRLGEFPENRSHIVHLIRQLTWASQELQEHLLHKATVRVSELGTRSDRQLHDFQVGVVKHLHMRGLLPELLSLYRAGTTDLALDYSIEDAIQTLRQKCPEFALLESRGIQHLLAASRNDIEDALWPALPEDTSEAEDEAADSRA